MHSDRRSGTIRVVTRAPRTAHRWRLALSSAWFVVWVSGRTLVVEPRRLSWTAPLVVGVTAAIGGYLGWLSRGPESPVVAGVAGRVVAGFGAGLVLWLVLYLVGGVVAEWIGFWRADQIFTGINDGVRMLARISVGPADLWRVRSVTAWPPRTGGGSAVMSAVISAADQAGATLVLEPITPQIALWYEGLGFTPRPGRSGELWRVRAPSGES